MGDNKAYEIDASSNTPTREILNTKTAGEGFAWREWRNQNQLKEKRVKNKNPPDLLVGGLLFERLLRCRETQRQCPQHNPARLKQQAVQRVRVGCVARSILDS